jgi:hypothetical protein
VSWRDLPEERTVVYPAVWLPLVDDFTGLPPVGRLEARLSLRHAGAWVPTGIAALLTPSYVLTYTGLGRRREPATATPRHYLVQLDADLYRPLYRADADGLEFDAFPYDTANPPAAMPPRRPLTLLPALRYPYPPHVPVLRGRVTADDRAVEDALVESQVTVGAVVRTERTLTDRHGGFGLPLRWSPDQPGDPDSVVVATDRRSGRTGAIAVTVPDDLDRTHRIAIA